MLRFLASSLPRFLASSLPRFLASDRRAGTRFVPCLFFVSVILMELSLGAHAQTVPAAPANVGITAGNGAMTLTWDAVTGATSYLVKRTSGALVATVSAPTTTFTESGLTNGTTYYYKVYAVNAQGESPGSLQAMATPGTASASPTGLYLVPKDARVDVSWIARPNTSSYKLKRSMVSGGPFALLATINSPASNYIDTNVVNGTTYYYVISSVSDTGVESADTDQKSAMPGVAFAAPTSLTAFLSGPLRIGVSWTASAGAASYRVKRATTSGGPYATVATADLPNSSWYDTNVAVNTTYYYIVVAVNSSGTESAPTNEASATPQAAPAAPLDIVARAGNAHVSLEWTFVAGATGYKVKRATISGGPYSTIATVTSASYTNTASASANYTNIGLTNGTTYFYVVSAISIGGESGNSYQASATPTLNLPPAPLNLTASDSNSDLSYSSSQVYLNWNGVPNVDKYWIYRGTTDGGPYDHVGGTDAIWNDFYDRSVTADVKYYYVITSLLGNVESDYSNQVSVTPSAIPPPAMKLLTLNPSVVDGGSNYLSCFNRSKLLFTLSGEASSDGTSITLTSSNPSVVSVPPSYDIEIEQDSGSITLIAQTVSQTTDVTITATYGGVAKQVVLRVLPRVVAPPFLSVMSTGSGKMLLSWSRVPWAVEYEVYRSLSAGSEDYSSAPLAHVHPPQWSQVGVVPGVVECVNYDLTDGVEYFYTVKAVFKDTAESEVVKSVASNEDSDIVDPDAIPWDSHDAYEILQAARNLSNMSSGGDQIDDRDDFVMMGPDGSVYSAWDGQQEPSGTMYGDTFVTGDDVPIALPNASSEDDPTSTATTSSIGTLGLPGALRVGRHGGGPYRGAATKVGYRHQSWDVDLGAVNMSGRSFGHDDTAYVILGSDTNGSSPNVDAGLQYDGQRDHLWHPFLQVQDERPRNLYTSPNKFLFPPKVLRASGSSITFPQGARVHMHYWLGESPVFTKTKKPCVFIDIIRTSDTRQRIRFGGPVSSHGNKGASVRMLRFQQLAQGPSKSGAPKYYATGSSMTGLNWNGGQLTATNETGTHLWVQDDLAPYSNPNYTNPATWYPGVTTYDVQSYIPAHQEYNVSIKLPNAGGAPVQ